MPNDPKSSAKPAFDPYARPPAPNIPPPDDAGGQVRAMWCSDCRAPLRTQYYAMNTRPVCPKCKTTYEAQIERGTGSAAFMRAVAFGGGAALGSAAILGAILLTIGPVGRILLGIAIGWAVGKAISKANGAAMALFATGYGMYKAWDLTSGGPALEVTGPYKVGSGPIAPAF